MQLSPITREIGRDILEWNIRSWSAALDYWGKHTSIDLSRCTALEIGSGSGGLSLWIALQGGDVVCSDVRDPSSMALPKHSRHGVSQRVRYEAIDATQIPYEDRFDVILFKSVLGGIGRGDRRDLQAEAIRQMYKALRKGGELFFAENLIGTSVHQALRRRFVRWGSNWRYVSTSEMNEHLALFHSFTYCTRGVLGPLGRNEVQRGLLARLDQALLERATPADWKYLIAGVARK